MKLLIQIVKNDDDKRNKHRVGGYKVSGHKDDLQQLLIGLERLFKQVEQNTEDIAAILDGDDSSEPSSGIIRAFSDVTSSLRSSSSSERSLKRMVNTLEMDNKRLKEKVKRLEATKESQYSLNQKIKAHEETIAQQRRAIGASEQEVRKVKEQLSDCHKLSKSLQNKLRSQSLSETEVQVVEWLNVNVNLLPVEAGKSTPESFVERINFLMLPTRFEQFHTRLNQAVMNNSKAHTPAAIEVVYRYLCQTQKAFGATWTVQLPSVGDAYNSSEQSSINKPSGRIETVWIPGVEMVSKKGRKILKPIVAVQ